MRHFALLCIISTLAVQSLEAASPPEVRGKTGMVASRSALASEVGADVLRRGGNAVDAAVATGFALAVTYPSAGNIGGGGFMVIRLTDGTLVVTNDHRERAPAGADRDMFLDAKGDVIAGLSTRSYLAVGVPGTVAGLLDVHERYGQLERSDVIDPAIALARDGFRPRSTILPGSSSACNCRASNDTRSEPRGVREARRHAVRRGGAFRAEGSRGDARTHPRTRTGTMASIGARPRNSWPRR